MKAKSSLLTAGVLMATLFAASPIAMAEHHGNKHKAGKWDKQEICENFREGKGPFSEEMREKYQEKREMRQQKMQEHRADMADRLKLNEEQRQIWDEIHQERQEKHQNRRGNWQEKMEKHCANTEE